MERLGLADCAIVAGLCTFVLWLVAAFVGDSLGLIIAEALVPGFFVIWGVLYVILQAIYVLESMNRDDN